jgi:hypothetical protein
VHRLCGHCYSAHAYENFVESTEALKHYSHKPCDVSMDSQQNSPVQWNGYTERLDCDYCLVVVMIKWEYTLAH